MLLESGAIFECDACCLGQQNYDFDSSLEREYLIHDSRRLHTFLSSAAWFTVVEIKIIRLLKPQIAILILRLTLEDPVKWRLSRKVKINVWKLKLM
jgi:hypothetical protein